MTDGPCGAPGWSVPADGPFTTPRVGSAARLQPADTGGPSSSGSKAFFGKLRKALGALANDLPAGLGRHPVIWWLADPER
jgi:hypothetical protein